MRSADVVVIGGGVIGASVAHHLAERGCASVVVLDPLTGAGGGSTGRATGGFRAQFGSAINVRLSLLSREKLLRFRAETGVDPGYRQVGYLFVAEDAGQMSALLEAQTVQRELGLVEARAVDADEVREINPAVAGPVHGGVFCPTDGYIRPLEILRGYVEAATRRGVSFEYGTGCGGMRVERGRVVAVRTTAGEIATGAVVNAAGPWAAGVAEMAGVRIPVRPLRRQVALTAPCTVLPGEMPMTIFLDDGFHLRVRDGRVLLLWPDTPHAPDPFDDGVQDEWVDRVTARAHQRIPCLRAVPIDRGGCWAGLYEMSPDGHALLGPAPEVGNLYLANGSSGHGVMHAPAVGQLTAEIMLDGRARTLDTHPLRPRRFEEGDPVAGSSLL